MAIIKAGVAGAGSMGRNHARIYSLLTGVELVAIHDADFSRAQAVAAEFGGRAVASLEELASLVDLASVAVPTVAHREVGCFLLDHGVHVLMEKPIAAHVADARALVDTARRCEKLLAVGHVERFNPVLSQLESKLTRPRFIEAHRLSPFPDQTKMNLIEPRRHQAPPRGMLLHCGAETVTREELFHVPTPLGTSTWYPLAHQTLLGEVETQLLGSGFEITAETHALSHAGARYFGVLSVTLPMKWEKDYSWDTIIGLKFNQILISMNSQANSL